MTKEKREHRKKQPWELDPKTIKRMVMTFRINNDITMRDFCKTVGMDHRTLMSIEEGVKVDPRIIGRINRKCPDVFA